MLRARVEAHGMDVQFAPFEYLFLFVSFWRLRGFEEDGTTSAAICYSQSTFNAISFVKGNPATNFFKTKSRNSSTIIMLQSAL